MKLRVCTLALGLMIAFSSESVVVGTINESYETEKVVIEHESVDIEGFVEEESEVEEVVPKTKSLGVCKLTAYCKENYPHICNNGSSNSTATGTIPTVGRTIAVDPSVIPYGSQVIINGHTYIAEDCGGAIKGNKIDILFETHKEALQFGVQYAEVFVVIS